MQNVKHVCTIASCMQVYVTYLSNLVKLVVDGRCCSPWGPNRV